MFKIIINKTSIIGATDTTLISQHTEDWRRSDMSIALEQVFGGEVANLIDRAGDAKTFGHLEFDMTISEPLMRRLLSALAGASWTYDLMTGHGHFIGELMEIKNLMRIEQKSM